MQFAPTDDQTMLMQGIRKLTQGVLRQTAAQRDTAGSLDAQTLARLRSLGVFGLLADPDHGGLGVDATTWILAVQELAVADAGLALAVAEHTLAAGLLAHGEPSTPDLTTMGQGHVLICLDVRDAAADLAAGCPALQAYLSQGVWSVSGATPWLALAQVASVAVVAAESPQGRALYAVDLRSASVLRSAKPSQLGLRSAAGASLTLDTARARQLTQTADVAISTTHGWLSLAVAAVAIGVGRAAAKAAGKYADERHQFGAPISRLQPVQWHIANNALDLDAADLLVVRAATLIGANSADKPLSVRALTAIHQAKVAAAEAAVRISDRAVQVHGGYGYTRDFPVERAYRDAALLQILHGTPSALKVLTARSLAA